MATTTSKFCNDLAHRFPVIAELLAAHLSDNDEILPHVFLADVARHLLSDGKDRIPIVQYLDDAMATEGAEVEDLIAVSIVEYLTSRDELDKVTFGLDAPHIHAEWERQQAS